MAHGSCYQSNLTCSDVAVFVTACSDVAVFVTACSDVAVFVTACRQVTMEGGLGMSGAVREAALWHFALGLQ